MKAFYVSLIVFFLLLVLIVCNGFYVRRTTSALEGMLTELSAEPPPDASALDQIEGKWKKSKRVLALSVSFEEMRVLDEQLLAMRAAVTAGSAADFEKARLLAIESLVHIREFEEFLIDNLI